VYGVEEATAKDLVQRYFQVNPIPDDITEVRTLAEWADAEAEEIYSNPRYWN
jgi:hypothetical protein